MSLCTTVNTFYCIMQRKWHIQVEKRRERQIIILIVIDVQDKDE